MSRFGKLSQFSLFLILGCLILCPAASASLTFVTMWGSSGSGAGQFNGPYGVAVESSTGYVYVADTGNNRVQVFDPSGAFVTKWGSSGSAAGQFSGPYGVAVNATGYVYVADTGNNRVQVFDPSGAFVTKWGSSGTAAGLFQDPFGVAVNANGQVYVTDASNDRVQVFDPSGAYVTMWGGYGSGAGLFNYPCGIAVDANGHVYVVDNSNNRVQVFDSSGAFITMWGSSGSGAGQFTYPIGVATTATGYVYVADKGNDRVQVFDSSGAFVTLWGSSGSGAGQFDFPKGVATTATGYVYVVEYHNNRVQVFSVGGGGTSPSQYAGGSGGGGGHSAPPPAPPVLQVLVPPPPPPPPPLPPAPAPAVSESSHMGFPGLTFNENGQNSLSLSLSSARAAGVSVTQYFNRVVVYQHSSPGITMTFWGDQFENKNGTITGKIKSADFVTDPIVANLSTLGNMTVSGSIHAGLPYLTQQVTIDTTLNGNVSADVTGQFRNVAVQNNLRLENVAYTMDLRRVNLTATGPANVTLTIPPSWIDQYGGKDAVRIGRISDDTGMVELLKTVYNGTDTKGNLVFRGESPNGSSIFGMLTAKLIAEKQQEQPNVTFEPLQKPAIATDIGMFAWLLGIVEQNPVLIIVAVAILAVAAYLGWWKRKY